jgi:hypothetical protein
VNLYVKGCHQGLIGVKDSVRRTVAAFEAGKGLIVLLAGAGAME